MMKNFVKKIKGSRLSASALALLLALSVLISAFSGTVILADGTEPGETEPWEGTAASGFADGTGTAADPYIVSTPAELLLAVSSTGLDSSGGQLCYKMTNDIYVNDVTDPAWKSGDSLIEWPVIAVADAEDTAFRGVFNGNGYKVFGLYVNKTYSAPEDGSMDLSVATGLFPAVGEGASITAVGVEDSYLSLMNNTSVSDKAYAGYAGILIGYAYNSGDAAISVDRCYSASDCSVKGAFAGMIAGLKRTVAKSVVITNCYTLSSGAVYTDDGTYKGNRYMMLSGDVKASSGLMEYNYSTGGISFTGCSSDTKANYGAEWVSSKTGSTVKAAKMQGADAFTNMPLLNGGGAFVLTETYPVLRAFVRDGSGNRIWDSSETAPTVGEGTETAPYIISEPSELAYIVKNGGDGKYYRLDNDIYLNDTARIDWTTGEAAAGYTPNSWYSKEKAPTFTGTIDGNGYTVYGLYYNTSGSTKWGNVGSALLPCVDSNSSATLKNLGLDCAWVKTSQAAGGFVGFNANGTVTLDQCYVGEKVTLTACLAGAFFGGASGKFTVTNCYSLATTVCSDDSGNGQNYRGLFGDAYKMTSVSTMQNCYNGNGPVTSKKSTMPATRSALYATERAASGQDEVAVLTIENMQGLDALTNIKKLSALGDAFTATVTYPILTVFAKASVGEQNKYWDGVTVTAPAKGDGTEAAPFEISCAAELAYVIKSGGGKDVYYKLTNDIYLNETDKVNWATGEADDGYTVNAWYSGSDAPAFSGIIDGDGHYIYGLYGKDSGTSTKWDFGSGTALIPYITSTDSVTLTNIGIDKAYIVDTTNASAFVAANNKGTLNMDCCFAGADVMLSGHSTGALLAICNGKFTITNCYSLATTVNLAPSATDSYYGLFGDMYNSTGSLVSASTLKYCYNATGPITSKSKTGPGTRSNNYAAADSGISGVTVLNEAAMQGLDVLSNADKMPGLVGGRAYQATEGYPILRVFSENPDEGDVGIDTDTGAIWNGTEALFFTEGSGTESDPFIISRGSELYLAISSGGEGKYYKLAKDIYLNDVSVSTWYKNQSNNEWIGDTSFSGTIDGDGHIVYGVWYPEDNSYVSAGLVPRFTTGTIKNLGVRYSYIHATKYAGGIVGRTMPGKVKTISQCFTDESVTVGYTANGYYGAGGIIGDVENDNSSGAVRVAIENCYSKAKVTGLSDDRANGLIGTVWKSAVKVTNCYSSGTLPYVMNGHGTVSSLYWDYSSGVNYTNGAAGLVDINTVISGVYNDTGTGKYGDNLIYVDFDDMRGEGAAQKLSAFDYDTVWETVEGGTPKLRIFTSVSGEDMDVSEDAQVFSGGKGRAGDPYIIENAAQLRYLVESTNTKGKHYKIVNDIYINDTSRANWMQNSPSVWYDLSAGKSTAFAGTVDGDGHYIYGLYVNSTPVTSNKMDNAAAGLFPRIAAGATVKNIHIRDSYISGTGYTGAIAGYVNAGGSLPRIIGCSADSTVTVSGQTAGGLIGGGGGTVELQFCYFTGKVTSTSEGRANALVGDIWKNGNRAVQCYSIGYQNFRTGFTPAVALALYGTVAQSRTVAVAESNMYGSAAKSAMSELDWSVWYTVKNGTPHLKTVTDSMLVEFNVEGEKGKAWSGLYASKFAGGAGTADDPYLIETPEQLAYMLQTNTSGKYYKLTADIYINDTSGADYEKTAKEWISGTFSGYFDGNGYVIHGLYFNTVDSNAALFTSVGDGVTITRLGVTDSTVIAESQTKQTYAAAIVAYAQGSVGGLTLSQCFADDSVYVEAQFAGGLVGGTGRTLYMDNCYFTGELTGSQYAGALLGNAWNAYERRFTDCYAVTLDRNPIGNNNGFGYAVIEDVYVDGALGVAQDATKLSVKDMQGSAAAEIMRFDFSTVWKTVEGGTPVLRCFKNAEKYTSSRPPVRIELSFAADGGDPVQPVYGYSGDKVGELPVPTRYGYEFAGWYVNSYKQIAFDLGYFPDFDMVLYAKWIQLGIENGFEGDFDETYDWNTGAQLYKPGVAGYNPKNIHGGLRSMQTLADSGEDAIFLINYEYPLEVGQKYDINFWVRIDEKGEGSIDFLHAEHPQWDSPVVGYEKVVELSGVTGGQWVEYKVTVTANAPYILVRASAGNEIYFDDFQIVPTGETGELGKLEGFDPAEIVTEPETGLDPVWMTVIIAGGAAVLAAAAVLIILLVKKKKNKKDETTPAE